MRIIHLTSVHSRFDTRVFLKECRGLAANGHDVTLVVADGKGNAIRDQVAIVDVGCLVGRVRRIIKTTERVFRTAMELDGEVYHLHDPELLPIGLRLKRYGKKVIFDSHEDVPKQLLSKPYLSRPVRVVASQAFARYERHVCRQLDAVIAATPSIYRKFRKIHPHTVVVNNYPMLGELENSSPWNEKHAEACYVGSIAGIRGIREIVRSAGFLQHDARINLVGQFSEAVLENEVKRYPQWSRINAYGSLDREGVRDVLARSMVGLVPFYALPNHIDAQPNKMFEYMSSGIPVIASDFPSWKEVIVGNHCGLCVDPYDDRAIGKAINSLLERPDHAREMGSNGKEMIQKKFNWRVEEQKLLQLYDEIA